MAPKPRHPHRDVIKGVAVSAGIILIAAGAFALANLWSSRPADTSHIRYSYSASDRFTRAQLDAAGRTVTDRFSDFHGCTLNEVSYDESKTDAALDSEERAKRESPSYDSSIYEAYRRYGRDRILMARADFTCDGTYAPLGRGDQTMEWYLRLDDDGRTWTEIDHGNG